MWRQQSPREWSNGANTPASTYQVDIQQVHVVAHAEDNRSRPLMLMKKETSRAWGARLKHKLEPLASTIDHVDRDLSFSTLNMGHERQLSGSSLAGKRRAAPSPEHSVEPRKKEQVFAIPCSANLPSTARHQHLRPEAPLLRTPVILPLDASNVAKPARGDVRKVAAEATRRALAGAAHS